MSMLRKIWGALVVACIATTTASIDGAVTGGLAVDTNLGWKGAEKYVATAPQIFDLWADSQERHDIFMNNFTEGTWIAPVMEEQLGRVLIHPPVQMLA